MSTRRAFAASLAGRYGVLAVRAVSIVTLARLLAPDDIGVFAVAAAIVAFAGVVSEFGATSWLVRHDGPTRDDYRSAAGLCAAITAFAVAALVLVAAAAPPPLVSEALAPALLVAALSLAPQPLAVVAHARLQRELRFGAIAIAETCRAAAQVATAIALALAGLGAVGLAAALVVEAVVGTALLVRFAGPGGTAPPRFSGLAAPARFGRQFASASALAAAGDALVATGLARALGYAGAGLFNRAHLVVTLSNRAVVDGLSPVVLTALMRDLRSRGDLARAFLGKTAFLCALQWPFFGFLALEAEAVVAVVLGPAWGEAAPAVRALAVMGLFQPLSQMSLKFFVALDQTRDYVRIQAVAQAARVGFTLVGALHSLEAACLGYALSHGLKAALATPALLPRVGATPGALARTLAQGFAVAALALAGPAALAATAADAPAALRLAASAALGAVGFVVAIYVVRHPAAAEASRAARLAAGRIAALRGRPGDAPRRS